MPSSPEIPDLSTKPVQGELFSVAAVDLLQSRYDRKNELIALGGRPGRVAYRLAHEFGASIAKSALENPNNPGVILEPEEHADKPKPKAGLSDWANDLQRRAGVGALDWMQRASGEKSED